MCEANALRSIGNDQKTVLVSAILDTNQRSRVLKQLTAITSVGRSSKIVLKLMNLTHARQDLESSGLETDGFADDKLKSVLPTTTIVTPPTDVFCCLGEQTPQLKSRQEHLPQFPPPPKQFLRRKDHIFPNRGFCERYKQQPRSVHT